MKTNAFFESPSLAPRLPAVGRRIARAALLVAVAGFLPANGWAASKSWSNTDTTWPLPDTATQNWNLEANWGGTAPGAEDSAYFSQAGTAVITDSVSISRLYLGSDTDTSDRGLLIASGGSLHVTGPYFELINGAGTQRLTVADGGSLTADTRIQLGFTTAGGTTAVFSNAGTVSAQALTVQRQSEFQMTGGTLHIVNTGSNVTGAFGDILIGAAGSTSSSEGKFVQSGGATTVDAYVQLYAGGTLEISGGSLAGTGNLWFRGATDTVGTLGGTIHVIGSGVSNIEFGGGLRYSSAADGNKATWAFTLDNSASHITKVKLDVDGTAGGNVRNGTLDVDLKGGVMLSGTDAMTLIEAPQIKTASDFLNAADYDGSKLWKQSIGSDGSNATLVVTLSNGAAKGTVDASGTPSLAFAASNQGFVNLANFDSASPLTLSLDIADPNGKLSLFTDALTAAGINWTAGDGDDEVAMTLDSAVSGGNYFVWDFSNIDPSMGVQGLSIAAVPEPSTWALLAGSLGVAALLRRRRFRG